MHVNNIFKIYKIEPKAYEYFEGRLDEGLTLSTYLKKTVDLKNGQVITFAPSNLTEDYLLNFNASIILGEPIPESRVQEIDNKLTRKWLVEQIKSFVLQSKNNYCIFEDNGEYPIHNTILRFPFRNVIYQQELYYILDQNDSPKTILQAILECGILWSPVMCIFTTIENMSSYFSDKDHIKSEDFFEIAATNTQKISLEAYDHEGYVLWEKTNSNNSK